MPARKSKPDPLRECLPMLRALADGTRLDLVRALAAGPKSVTTLAEGLGITVYNTSRHLKVLREAGMVEPEVSAQQRIYRLSAPIQAELARNGRVLELGCCSFRLAEV